MVPSPILSVAHTPLLAPPVRHWFADMLSTTCTIVVAMARKQQAQLCQHGPVTQESYITMSRVVISHEGVHVGDLI